MRSSASSAFWGGRATASSRQASNAASGTKWSVSRTRGDSTNPTGVSAVLAVGADRHQRRREIEGATLERQPAARLDLADLTLGRHPQPGRRLHPRDLLDGRLEQIDPDCGGRWRRPYRTDGSRSWADTLYPVRPDRLPSEIFAPVVVELFLSDWLAGCERARLGLKLDRRVSRLVVGSACVGGSGPRGNFALSCWKRAHLQQTRIESRASKLGRGGGPHGTASIAFCNNAFACASSHSCFETCSPTIRRPRPAQRIVWCSSMPGSRPVATAW